MFLFVCRIILGIVAVIFFRDREKLLPSIIIGLIAAIISIATYEPSNPFGIQPSSSEMLMAFGLGFILNFVIVYLSFKIADKIDSDSVILYIIWYNISVSFLSFILQIAFGTV